MVMVVYSLQILRAPALREILFTVYSLQMTDGANPTTTTAGAGNRHTVFLFTVYCPDLRTDLTWSVGSEPDLWTV